MKESERLKSVRSFEREDIPVVADLLGRLLLPEAGSGRQLPASQLPDYLEEVFFDSPMALERNSSLVSQDAGGRITGFIGVITHKMLFRDRPIRAGVSLHFMVDPDARSSMAGLQLLKTLFAGDHDLLFTDGAGDMGLKVWEGLGGCRALLYSQRWIRMLRPVQQAVASIGKHSFIGRSEKLNFALRFLNPPARLVDSTAARFLPRFFPESATSLIGESLRVETVLEYLPQFTKGLMLRPDYDEKTLTWLLAQARKYTAYGELISTQLRDDHGEIAGWYLYYLKNGGMSEVIHLAARKKSEGDILDHLLEHARSHGANTIAGRVEPRWMQEMADRGCFFGRIGRLTLIQSHNSDILNAIHRGDAFLTQLEGEWCLTP